MAICFIWHVKFIDCLWYFIICLCKIDRLIFLDGFYDEISVIPFGNFPLGPEDFANNNAFRPTYMFKSRLLILPTGGLTISCWFDFSASVFCCQVRLLSMTFARITGSGTMFRLRLLWIILANNGFFLCKTAFVLACLDVFSLEAKMGWEGEASCGTMRTWLIFGSSRRHLGQLVYRFVTKKGIK